VGQGWTDGEALNFSRYRRYSLPLNNLTAGKDTTSNDAQNEAVVLQSIWTMGTFHGDSLLSASFSSTVNT